MVGKPAGWHSVTPRIITKDVRGLVQFLTAAFDARGEALAGRPSEVTIGDSVVMISDGGGLRDEMPAFLYVYVESVDDTYRKAVAAGAETIDVPESTPWGDRRATVRDAWNNIWQIATYEPR